MSAIISAAVSRGVATVTMGRLAGRTSLDSAARTQLMLALRHVAADPTVLAVVLRGSDDFCQGRDLDEYAARLTADPVHGSRELEAQTAQVVHALAAVPQPVIAAVRGQCTGEGLMLALACDLRVLADDSVLAVTADALGERPGSHLRSALRRLVGPARSAELALSGRTFTAREAVDWGIVSDVVPDAQVVAVALGQASMIARIPADQLGGAKVMLAGAATMELEQALRLSSTTS